MAARTYTRAQLRTRIRQLADMVNSRLVDDATELNDWIDVANAEFHEFLYQSGWNYKTAETTVTIAGGANSYPLPAGLLGVLKVEYRVTTEPRYSKLEPVSPMEDHRFSGTGQQASCYQLVNDTIVFFPTPPNGQVYRVRYVPAAVKLTSDSDTVDGFNGWEHLIVLDCVINCLLKEESDVAAWVRERDDLRARIKAAAEDRMLSDGGRIIDVRNDLGENDPAELPRARVWMW